MSLKRRLASRAVKSAWRFLALFSTRRCRYGSGRLKHVHHNLFYCKNLDLYEQRPQPPKWLWKLMHRTTLLSAYRDPKVLKQREEHADQMLQKIEQHVDKGVLFDVGANGGAVLEVALRRGWSHAEGNELSRVAIEWAKTHYYIDIHDGYFEDLSLKPESFDAIVMTNVLEHTHNPLFVLQQAFNAIRPKGVIFILVPTKTTDELTKHYEQYHLFEFQEKSLRALTQRAGFETISEVRRFSGEMHVTEGIYQKPATSQRK